MRGKRRELFMMGALVEIDGARVTRYADDRNLAREEALPRLLSEAAVAAEQAGRVAAQEAGQKLIYSRASVDRERPARLTAHVGLNGEREGAEVAFDRWREALAERTTVLRTFLRGEGIFREWTDERYQKELEERWSGKDEAEIRLLTESSTASAAEREQPRRPWWRDWKEAAQHPRKTRTLLAASFALFGLLCALFIAAWWSGLPAAVLGGLAGLAIAEHGIRAGRSNASALDIEQ